MFDVACPVYVAPSGLFADDSDTLAEQTAMPNGVLLRRFSGVREVMHYPLSSLPSQRSEQFFSTAPADVVSQT